MKVFSRANVKQHNKADDCFIIIDDKVYDMTKFMGMHPGGEGVIMGVAGQDATEVFYGMHRHEILVKYSKKLLIGELDAEGKKSVKPFDNPEVGKMSVIPFMESQSPFFTKSHNDLRKWVRTFVATELGDLAKEDDFPATEHMSKDTLAMMGKAGVLNLLMGPGEYLTWEGVPKLPAGLKPEEFDFFHLTVVGQEIKRLGNYGMVDGLAAGMIIGLPPVLNFGSKELAKKILPPVLRGEKFICLAISDPYAGSDVANMQATAVKSACGNFYIVNGVKKWITNGVFADYFTTAVRTGGDGNGGVSMLLIERGPGVSTKRIKTSYTSLAGTAYVEFTNVKVPVENLLGEENKGFKCVMANFNTERWGMAVAQVALNRVIIEECYKWASQRKVFGKNLMAQPVIRNKIANMIAQNEACDAWASQITYQMNNMTHKEISETMGGPIALLKMQSTRVSTYVADHAVQIFGGRALTRTGMGRVIERFNRTYKFGAILGGAEEILADLGVRMMMKQAPNSRL